MLNSIVIIIHTICTIMAIFMTVITINSLDLLQVIKNDMVTVNPLL